MSIRTVSLPALLLTALLASPVLAQEATPSPEFDNFVATKTRAEVRAELFRAIAAGEIARNEADEQRLAARGFKSRKTRAQVLAEAVEADRLGLIPRNEYEYQSLMPTAEQLRLVAEAGLRAVDSMRVGQRP